jgi:Arc/MetJ-type ribon-helix-helix transcriptional regulator
MKKRGPKERASFTLDKETILILDKLLMSDKYRNKSHIVENAIKLLSKLDNKESKKDEKDE